MPRKSIVSDNTSFISAVESSRSIREVIQKLGLVPAGGNYTTVKNRLKVLGLDTRSWLGQGHRKGSTKPAYVTPINQLLVKGRNTNCNNLRKRLIREGLLPNVCSDCGLASWKGRSITLHLDHVNGDHFDNELSNLRLLCPNCHSQTETYCGRNIGKVRE